MFSLELLHQGNSNDYIQDIIFNTKKNITLNYHKSTAMGFFSKGFKNKLQQVPSGARSVATYHPPQNSLTFP